MEKMKQIEALLNSNRLKNNLESEKYNNDIEVQKALKILYQETSFYDTDDLKIRYQIFKQQLVKEDLICKNQDCSNFVKFNDRTYKFRNYCCNKCMSNSKQVREKTKKTCIKKYGVSSVNSTEEKKKQIVETCIKKYGTSCVFSNQDIIKKIHDTHVMKFGTHFNQQHIQHLDKWNNKEYIELHFLDDSNQILITKFQEFFNCQDAGMYKKFKELNIEYKKRKGNSEAEYEIINFINNSNTIQGDQLIIGKELDILVPNKFAIEYQGLMFHSHGTSKYSMFDNPKENKKRHIIKTDLCEAKNIQLFQIFENEWLNKQDIWKSVINSKLGRTTRLYARKCEIKIVSSSDSKKFELENHLQGPGVSKLRYGLYYNDELVSLMTFGKARMSKKYEYELIRFCSKLNTTIVGGASKLLKHFEREINPKSLVSYANRRWSTGNLYEAIGFTFSHISAPNYFYFHIDSPMKLESRNKYQKHKLSKILSIFDITLTETINMYNNNYRKIYDAGNIVYFKHY